MGSRLRLIFGIAALAGGLELTGCQPVDATSTTPSAADLPSTADADGVRCGIDMRNVTLHVADGIVLRVRALDGELVATKRGSPPVFDDPRSYILRLKSADMSIDAASLNALMARVVAGQPSIKELTLSIADGQVIQKGKMRKGITIPFTLKTSVSPTSDGRVRLHATSLKAIGIPVKGMLDFFGVELASLMKIHGPNGLQVEGDDILLAPAAILPPPATEGVVKSVRVEGDRLVMQLAGNARPPKRPATLPDPGSRNYVYFHGGSVRFGKLTMSDADLQLVDADPRDPFDFFPNRYLPQLVAGYSKTTPRGGLRTQMPDYSDLRNRQR
jgi:hypothetical protein